MGIYNDIILNKQIKCPRCKAELKGWQSKSMSYAGYNLANTLQNLKINTRFTGEIHTSCEECKLWADYGVIKGQIVPINTYEKYLADLRYN